MRYLVAFLFAIVALYAHAEPKIDMDRHLCHFADPPVQDGYYPEIKVEPCETLQRGRSFVCECFDRLLPGDPPQPQVGGSTWSLGCVVVDPAGNYRRSIEWHQAIAPATSGKPQRYDLGLVCYKAD